MRSPGIPACGKSAARMGPPDIRIGEWALMERAPGSLCLPATAQRPIRVLVADDSVVMRNILRQVLTGPRDAALLSLPCMEVCGMAADGLQCLDRVRDLAPDLLLLDIEMPRLGGLGVLDELRRTMPGLPVIVCSAMTEPGAAATLEALARGAADYVTKPTNQSRLADSIASLAGQLLPRVAALRRGRTSAARSGGRPADLAARRPAVGIVVIGVSTGGPTALERMLPLLPGDFAVPVVIVQHMPEVFTRVLSQRLRGRCPLGVEEAEQGAELKPGGIWIAKGDWHVRVEAMRGRKAAAEALGRQGAKMRGPAARLSLQQGEPENGCRPSVDQMFRSAARVFGEGVLGVVMTGMGCDGLEGSRAIRRAGGAMLAQDEATSAIWGMPRRVAEAGLANCVLPLERIAEELVRRVGASPDASSGRGEQEAADGMFAG